VRGFTVLLALLSNGTPAVRRLPQEQKPPPTRVLDDPTVQHGKVTFQSGDKEIDGYLARPKAAGKYPAVLVIAGNRITEEYIPNTCAALAVAGYIGLALRGQGTSVKVYLYEGADHGFLAYTRPYYQPDAAQSAWKRTVEFLDSQLKK
jgi:dienelactone hydrolase